MAHETAYTSFSLTVAEGKRLIARGVAQLPCVKAAMKSGMVAVTKGTTTAYVLEELLGEEVDRMAYVSGRTLPSGHPERSKLFKPMRPQVVFRNGEAVEGMDFAGGLKEMTPGDVVITLGAGDIRKVWDGLAERFQGFPARG